ncbi:MAG: hypothetical protein H6521_01065 [Mycolicibacterium sp.]|nr:hypothetical protein [Mycobacterium sp.]MCB9407986.1 hypothetical protein [Mycolicibacterium sp.]
MTVHIMTACAGFLLAVLWMDLIFDTQIARWGRGGKEGATSALESICGYYRRATTTSRPMSALIPAVMGILLAALAFEATRGIRPAWLMALSGVLAGGPILLALLRTVPNAARLGRRTDPEGEQIRLAQAILGDHLLCLVAVVTFLVIWLVGG